jgi:hypothetical protein
MRLLRRAAVLLVLLAAGCGGPLLSAELEIPELGLKVPQQTFPASTADPSYWCAPDQADCIATDLEYDIGSEVDLLDQKGVTDEVRLTHLALVLTSTTVQDLGGVRSVVVEVVPPDGGASIPVATYARSASDPLPTRLAVAGNSSVDLGPMIRSGIIHLRVKMSFDGPTPEFTADVEAVFYLRITLDYLETAGL